MAAGVLGGGHVRELDVTSTSQDYPDYRQNLLFAFGYNALGVPVAAGVLYPWTGVLLGPMLASAAMSLSSVSVIANALRLNRVVL